MWTETLVGIATVLGTSVLAVLFVQRRRRPAIAPAPCVDDHDAAVALALLHGMHI
jgi:hypothetical protein